MERKKPKDYPYAQMPAELNSVWNEMFGHSLASCFELSKLPNEIGKLHKDHIRYVLNKLTDKHVFTPDED